MAQCGEIFAKCFILTTKFSLSPYLVNHKYLFSFFCSSVFFFCFTDRRNKNNIRNDQHPCDVKDLRLKWTAYANLKMQSREFSNVLANSRAYSRNEAILTFPFHPVPWKYKLSLNPLLYTKYSMIMTRLSDILNINTLLP